MGVGVSMSGSRMQYCSVISFGSGNELKTRFAIYNAEASEECSSTSYYKNVGVAFC